MYKQTILLCGIFLILLYGCTYYDSYHSYSHQNMNVTNNHSKEMSQQKALHTKKTNLVTQTRSSGNQMFFPADELSRQLTETEHILRADVLVLNNEAYTGVVLRRGAVLNEELKQEIKKMVQSTYKTVKHVHIFDQPHFVREINVFSNRLKRGEQNVQQDFEKMVDDFFHGGKFQ